MSHADVKHDYHLVNPSPWPVVGSFAAFLMLGGAVLWMNDSYGAFGGHALRPTSAWKIAVLK